MVPPTVTITEEAGARARKLAEELQREIEENFLKPPNPEVITRTTALREALEKMGFVVEVEYHLDPRTLTLMAPVTLWLPRHLQ